MNKTNFRRPTLLGSLGLALLLSAAGAFTFTFLSQLLPVSVALKLVVAALGLGYIGYLLSTTARRSGRWVLTATWLVLTTFSFVIDTGLLTFILTQALLLWLIRSFCRYRHLLPAILDGAVVAAGLIFALWASLTTSSLFIALWCFYLVQSVFPLIPNRSLPFFDRRAHSTGASDADVDTSTRTFNQATQSAQAALTQLSRVN